MTSSPNHRVMHTFIIWNIVERGSERERKRERGEAKGREAACAGPAKPPHELAWKVVDGRANEGIEKGGIF